MNSKQKKTNCAYSIGYAKIALLNALNNKVLLQRNKRSLPISMFVYLIERTKFVSGVNEEFRT